MALSGSGEEAGNSDAGLGRGRSQRPQTRGGRRTHPRLQRDRASPRSARRRLCSDGKYGSLITPERFVAEPSASCHRNPWLETNERQVSDGLVVLAKFSAILDFVENLLLHASARHWARSGPERCGKIPWSPTVKDDPRKAEISIHLGEGTPKRSQVAWPSLRKWL